MVDLTNASNTDLHSELSRLLPNFRNLHDIGTCKPLAKFGDLITNLVYSVALCKIQLKLDQKKVSKKILSNALKHADLKIYSWTRADAHAMADTVEAFIGYMYLKCNWSVYFMAEIIIKILGSFDIREYKDEIEGSILAFSSLLIKIRTKLQEDFTD